LALQLGYWLEPQLWMTITIATVAVWIVGMIVMRLTVGKAMGFIQSNIAVAMRMQSVAMVLLVEVLLPVPRFPYSNIILVLIIGLMIVPRGVEKLYQTSATAYWLVILWLIMGFLFGAWTWSVLLYFAVVLPLVAAFVFSGKLIAQSLRSAAEHVPSS